MYKGGALAGTSWSFSTKKTSYNLKGEKLASKNWIRIKYLFVSIYLFFTLKIGINKAIYYSKRRATNENNYFLILEQSNTFKTTTSKKGHKKNGTLWYTIVHYGTLWYTYFSSSCPSPSVMCPTFSLIVHSPQLLHP